MRNKRENTYDSSFEKTHVCSLNETYILLMRRVS